MLVKVWMPNETFVIMDEDKVDEHFPDSANIEIEEIDTLPDNFRINSNEFKSLVGSLDAKFGHTYLDVVEE